MLALRIALRELRGGIHDFRIFLGCLIIGVAVIAGVTAVSRHIENGMRQQSQTLLGGDVELSLANAKATPEQMAFLQRYGRVSLTVSLRAMAIHGEHTALVEIKGVDAAYPLLGEVKLSSGKPLAQALSNNGIVSEANLFERLGAAADDTILLGDTPFRLADTLQKEPDSIANPLSLGPRVLVRLENLDTYHFLLPGNLVHYHYHVLLKNPAQLGQFQQALAQTFPAAPWVVKTANDNNRGIKEFVERLQLFMTLAGLSALLIGGVGIMNATETYLQRKSSAIATLKTLGAPRRLVFSIYLLILMLITLAGAFIGGVLGVLLASFSLPFLAEFLPIFTTGFTFDGAALLLAMSFGTLTVLTFSIAALGRGIEVKPAVLFRGLERAQPRLPRGKLAANLFCALLLIATLLLSADDRAIAAGFILCALLAFALFALAAMAVKSVARRLHPRAPWAKLGIANLCRPGARTLSIMLSTGIGLTVLLALWQVEGNFQKEINETIPALAPSLFFIDIQPDQQQPFMAFLHDKAYVSDIASQPMIRGRIAKINGVPVERANVNSDAKWAIESDRGLTWAAAAPPHTHLLAGSWWPADYHGKTLVSLDAKLASGMGLHIGDTMTLNILGKDIDAQIANLREVNYLSFRINFAMVLSPGAIEQFPATAIATAHIDGADNEAALMRAIAGAFPNISSIRIEDSIAQIRDIIGHIAMALRLCALVVLVSGLLVLTSALAATLDARAYDTVLLKVLGAQQRDITRMFLTEWLLLALVTALLSCVLACGGAWLIFKRLNWIAFEPLAGIMLITTLLTLAVISLTGLALHWRIFNVKAISWLRNE